MHGATLVTKYGNLSVRENLVLVTVRLYVHPSMYASVQVCGATCVFWREQPCYHQLTPVKSRYLLTSIT